jgi:outer membrane protein assembly factor BamE (lipoprotein component of BamABCDE complex)
MPRLFMSKTLKLCAGGGLALALLGTTACKVVSPIERHHGYLAEKDAFEQIELGKDTKASLNQKLGSPSTRGTFDPNVWYYITQRDKRFAFFSPDTVQQDILEVRFDQDGRVAALKRYDVKDGNRIAYVNRETPTRGKELGFWEQMFGNVGRGLPGQAGQQQPGGGR